MRPISLALTAMLAVCTSSCTLFQPKDPAAAAYDPYGQQTNPYGQAPAATNPYTQVPATNPYSQVPATNPYTQPPATNNPYGSYEPAQSAPPQPSYNPTPAYSGGGGGGRSVIVKSGDTLTGIAKRNGTSAAAIRSANGMSGDLIKIGQRLNLP
jgi:LysM repeat protein